MSEDEVVALMSSARSEQQWNDFADRVKQSFGGVYPSFWYKAIVLSGVLAVTSSWWHE